MSTSIETFVLRRSFWERKVSSPFNRFIISSFHSEKHSSFCFETKLKRRYWNTGTNFNCSSQPSSVHWLSTSIFPCSFDVCLSRHYDVSSFFSLFGRPNQPRHHTWYLSRTPRVYSCKFFLVGVNFYRFNAQNWHFRQILRKKVAFFFYRFNAKNWRFSL